MTTALYRRYRPETFADVIGQDHVTGPLMQALRSERVGHAYLFSGPRGCGKTTSARILARCLNCDQGPTPEPCGECDSCVALARGGSGSVDVIEIDAASHGGVDDARDLRERASFGPAQSRYKIYIIDEAHMVTPQGFNALLKIVEEPPEHVKFVFATTEPEKVIGTIRSRTHHYPFRLVPPQRLTDYMQQLCEAEGISVEPGVLSFVTRAGAGSVRDSLSVLDQLIAGSGQEGLTYAGAAALLGFTDGELLDATVDALAAGDGAATFRQVDRVIESGLDPRRFVEDLLERLRDLIVVQAVPQDAGRVLRGMPEDQLERIRQQAGAFGQGTLSRAADIVNAGLTEMTGATSPRLQLELICARVLLPAASGEQGYAARLDRLERRLDIGGTPSAVQPAAPAAPASAAPDSGQVSDAVAGLDTPTRPSPALDQPEEDDRAAEPSGETSRDLASAADRPGQTPPGLDTPTRPSPALDQPEEDDRAAEPSGASSPPADRVAEPLGEAYRDQTVEPPAAPAQPTGGLDTDAIRRAWPDVLDRIFRAKRVTWALLSQHAHVLDYDGDRLLLGTSSTGLAQTFARGQHPDVVRQALVEALGVDVRVEAQPDSGGPGGGGSTPPAPPPPEQPPGEADRSGSQADRVAGEERAAYRDPMSAAPDSGQVHGSPGLDTQASHFDTGLASSPQPSAPLRSPALDQRGDGGASGSTGDGGSGRAREAARRATQQRRSPDQTDGGWGAVSAPPPEWATSTDSPPSGAGAPSSQEGAPTPDDPSPADSFDDEDVDDLGEVGIPVITSVLGGTVIDDEVE